MSQFPINPKNADKDKPQVMLAWSQDDIENRLGFKGGRHTGVNHVLAFIMAASLSVLFYAFTVLVLKQLPITSPAANMILRPSNQYTMIPATLFFFGGVAVLFMKSRKLKYQQRALALSAVPAEPEFVLTEVTAAAVIARIHTLVDHPRHFILLNRIDRALSNLKNIGQVNDVSSILRAQADNDEDLVASSYTLLNGLVWAIPVLGFIGTVQGLSMAIGKFTQTLQAAGEISMIRTSLQGVTTGLATAFETTLIALIFALILQLWITFQQKNEMSFLDECNDYCHAHVVSKLRIIDRAPASAPTTPESKS
jgi:biopolymer transport protein ExbB/TolQ